MNDDWSALKQQVKDASDIVEIVGGYIPLRPVGPTFKGICPFHEDHRPSFDVDPRRQRYRCWACSKFGDVFAFVMEYERVEFRDALELLARRAGISIEKVKKTQHGPSRAVMLDCMRWAQEQYADCLLNSPQAEDARKYLGERGLRGETVRQFGLGFAPGTGAGTGEWLAAKALNAGLSAEILVTVGLIAKRNEGPGYYDRFRDRVLFPIRDLGNQVVGFGGRILPSAPNADSAPKYYNTSQTPLFDKSNQLYALDAARTTVSKTGTLVVVEGYMDVLMAHQHGIHTAVAPMGTALTAKHIQKLRGMANRVILIFDADAGGTGGVDRALELFVSQNLDLRIGILPEGLDPCDLLIKGGAEAMQKVFDGATDVFEFKLQQVWPGDKVGTLEEKRAAAEKMLMVLSAAPDLRGMKMELMVNRIAHRLGVKEQTIWSRLRDLKQERERTKEIAESRASERADTPPPQPMPESSGPAPEREKALLEVLLGKPELVARVEADGLADKVSHPVIRRLLQALLGLHAEGKTPDLDHLREAIDDERLLKGVLRLYDAGIARPSPADDYEKILDDFRRLDEVRRNQSELKAKVSETNDHATAREELAKLLKQRPEFKNNKEGHPPV